MKPAAIWLSGAALIGLSSWAAYAALGGSAGSGQRAPEPAAAAVGAADPDADAPRERHTERHAGRTVARNRDGDPEESPPPSPGSTRSAEGASSPDPGWYVPDIFTITRNDPAHVDVAALASSTELNPEARPFSKELQEALAEEIGQLEKTFLDLTSEMARVEPEEFARAAKSGYATRRTTKVERSAAGGESVTLPVGVVGEETTVSFGEHGVEIVRVPARMMQNTNACRAAWLSEWLEFWHAAVPMLERGGHLDAERGNAIYARIHADFAGVLEGFEVSFEDLQERRKEG